MVGLITPVGAVLAGRMYTPGYEVLAGADTFETGTAGSWGGIANGNAGLLTAGIAIRSSKALQYRIALPSGISAALMYGFKNSGYIDLDKRFYAANVMYKANGFNVGVGYNNGQDQDGNSGLISTVIGGSYETGPFKFFAGYLKQKNENSVVVPLLTSLTWDAGIAPTLAAQPAALQAALRQLLRQYPETETSSSMPTAIASACITRSATAASWVRSAVKTTRLHSTTMPPNMRSATITTCPSAPTSTPFWRISRMKIKHNTHRAQPVLRAASPAMAASPARRFRSACATGFKLETL